MLGTCLSVIVGLPDVKYGQIIENTSVFLPGKSHGQRSLVGYSPWGCKRFGHNLKTFLVAQTVKRLPTIRENQVQSLGWEDPLEKKMTTHSSILAWKIPWTEELGAGYYPWGRKESGTTERLH